MRAIPEPPRLSQSAPPGAAAARRRGGPTLRPSGAAAIRRRDHPAPRQCAVSHGLVPDGKLEVLLAAR